MVLLVVPSNYALFCYAMLWRSLSSVEESVVFYEILVTIYQTTRRRIPTTTTEYLHYIKYITIFWANRYFLLLIESAGVSQSQPCTVLNKVYHLPFPVSLPYFLSSWFSCEPCLVAGVCASQIIFPSTFRIILHRISLCHAQISTLPCYDIFPRLLFLFITKCCLT